MQQQHVDSTAAPAPGAAGWRATRRAARQEGLASPRTPPLPPATKPRLATPPARVLSTLAAAPPPPPIPSYADLQRAGQVPYGVPHSEPFPPRHPGVPPDTAVRGAPSAGPVVGGAEIPRGPAVGARSGSAPPRGPPAPVTQRQRTPLKSDLPKTPCAEMGKAPGQATPRSGSTPGLDAPQGLKRAIHVSHAMAPGAAPCRFRHGARLPASALTARPIVPNPGRPHCGMVEDAARGEPNARLRACRDFPYCPTAHGAGPGVWNLGPASDERRG